MTDTTQGELWPELSISVRPWGQPQQAGEAGQALTAGHDDALSRYADAIAKIESAGSGGYAAQGPVTKSGDRAYGRYQVMGQNIPEWTREALGRSLTPEEFLASPAAQDAVFRHKFGSYVAQYGNPADAASAWLTGKPLATGAAAKDQLGTSGASYAQKFLANLSGAEGGALLSSSNLLAQAPQAKQTSIAEQLLGLNGVPRYQLWPERMVREALAAPHQALTQGFVPGSQDEIAAAQAIANFVGSGSLPLAQGGAVGALGGRLTAVRGPAEAAAGATAPVFHSTAGQVLENSGFNRASPSQWLAYLRNAQGVKGEELDWTGLADRLGNATESQLTKADLLQHLAENQVDLREVARGDPLQAQRQEHDVLADLQQNVSRYGMQLNPTQQARLEALRGQLAGSEPALPTRYGSYILPGAEPGSYREALLTVPHRDLDFQQWLESNGKEIPHDPTSIRQLGDQYAAYKATEAAPYRSSHWDEPNVLGHVRMNDRQVAVPGAERPLDALFLEELQSDLHQQGRREGYKSEGGSVTDAPWRSSWPELLLKRMIREAAESGKDALAWTSGETQAARYDLSKQVEKLEISRGQNGKYEIYGTPKGDRYPVKLGDAVPEEKLADYVGKDLANKAVEDLKGDRPAGRVYSGLDLRVGGEGMLKFYDDMLPKAADKLVKKYGGKVELGQTRVRSPGASSDFSDVPVHILRLTPELRKAALSQGFPLFQAGVPLSVAGPSGRVHTLTQVSHDPFSNENLLKGNAT